jgi:lysozyme
MKWLIPTAALTIAAGVYLARRTAIAQDDPRAGDEPTTLETLQVEAETIAAEVRTAVFDSPAAWLSTSPGMQDRLKQREGLKLARYRLGDGGWTIGYGRYYADGSTECPQSIDQATAEAWFQDDLVNKGEKWVKLYVTVPITQGQFDALTSMAYNLRPSSFKQVADAVNAGEDPTPIAMKFTRPGTNLERGLIARRNEELSIFNGTMEA